MAIKMSEHVTLTILKTTVRKLRAMKGPDTWDQLLLRLSNRGRCGIECMNCGRWLEAGRTDISQDTLARDNGWKPMVIYGEETVGFLCDECAKKGDMRR